MDKLRVCAVIVTYNRKLLLQRCLTAILKQSQQVSAIIIVDNASNDGTFNYLVQNSIIADVPKKENDSLINVSSHSDTIYYYRISKNLGGAGGFYYGLKLAYEQKIYDAFWLMDDDGYPSSNCLEKQCPYLKKYDYVMPVSINIENHLELSWESRMPNKKKTRSYEELKRAWGNIMPFVFPFNGCLFSSRLVKDVGYIKPELFIWGDDYEHYYRCLKMRFKPITLLDAVFYHPANKVETCPIMFGLFKIPYVSSKLRFTCLIRNWTYIYKKNHMYFQMLRNFIAYTWLFLITRRMDMINYKLYIASFFDGLFEKWERHFKYLKSQ